MHKSRLPRLFLTACCLLALAPAYGQGTLADYERAAGLKKKYEAAALDIPGGAHWIGANRLAGGEANRTITLKQGTESPVKAPTAAP